MPKVNDCPGSRVRKLRHPWFLFGALLTLLPVQVHAQSVFGRVMVEGDSLGIAGAELTLTDFTGSEVARVQSSEGGAFRLPAPTAGRFSIRASRIGLATVEVEVALIEGEAMEVELQMAEEAIPLEPLLVVGRREIKDGTLDQFYDRMARMKQRGRGQFLTKEQLEARIGLSLALILQTVPGVWVQGPSHVVQMTNPGTGGGTFCTPEFFLDGRPMLGGFREIESMDLEGVEVYRGFAESVDGIMPDQCGQIFIWRRADWGNPFAWGRAFVAVGLGALLLALAALF